MPGKKVGAKELVGVLKELQDYWEGLRGSAIEKSMIYCPGCESLGFATGDYRGFVGNDCLGSHYELRESPFKCEECDSTKFVKISPQYILDAVKKLGPESFVDALNMALKSKNLYLGIFSTPDSIRAWKSLSYNAKLAQVKLLVSNNRKIENLRAQEEETDRQISELEDAVSL